MEMSDKLYAPATVCLGKNNGTSLVEGGWGGGFMRAPEPVWTFIEEKNFLPLPGLKPRKAEPIIQISMSSTLSRLQFEKYSFEICVTRQEFALKTR